MGCSPSAPVGGTGTGRRPEVQHHEHIRNKVVLTEKDASGNALKAEWVDLFNGENKKKHETSEYEKNLVLRRGSEFKLLMHFHRPIEADKDIVILQFAYGRRPQESKGTIIRIPLNLQDGKSTAVSKTWSCVSKVSGPNEITCDVTSSPQSSIGLYTVFVESKVKDKKEDFARFKIKDTQIILIFNPWCKADVAYMGDEKEREEYVLNESGRIWKSNGSSVPWNFGQFEFPCLEVALELLDQSGLSDNGKGSAVAIIRFISSCANSCDNNGVLTGNWSGNYGDETAPSKWNGSPKILTQFYNTKTTVKYGQCWVFSGIVTTLCRTLGIPTRSVTNTNSAHDTDASMTIDNHFDKNGDPIEYLNDSIWNFHVWNESWIRREDLPDGYDGWQAHDATPQETSEGLMRCGPCSVKALKEGHVYLNYDAKFIYAEVNGDRCFWKENDEGIHEITKIQSRIVGTRVSTKAVGSHSENNIVDLYKYREGTEEERKVAESVKKYSSRRDNDDFKAEIKESDIECSIQTPDVMIGEDFDIPITVKNVTKQDRTVRVKANLVNILYIGTGGKTVKKEEFKGEIPAGSEKTFKMAVPRDIYMKNRAADDDFVLYLSGQAEESGISFASMDTFCLKNPKIQLKGPNEIDLDADSTFTVEFENTSQMPLTNCKINYEGSGSLGSGVIRIGKTINPKDHITENFTIHPKKKFNYKELIVSFSSDQIASAEDSKYVFETYKPPPTAPTPPPPPPPSD